MVTDDHIPPKALFPKPRPSDLITVPICSSCNAGTSQDDEYFRNAVALHFKAAQHPTAQRVLPSVWNSLERPEARGLKTAFLGALHEVAVVSPMGLYVGKAAKYDVDFKRVERVAERIARGLFFYHRTHAIPRECRVAVMCLAGRRLRPDLQESLQAIAGGLRAAATHELGPGVFRYRFAFVETANQHPNSCAWLFSLYEAVEFVVLVVDMPAELSASACDVFAEAPARTP